MKSKEELKAIRSEYESLASKLRELSEEELKEVIGGREEHSIKPDENKPWISWNPAVDIIHGPLN